MFIVAALLYIEYDLFGTLNKVMTLLIETALFVFFISDPQNTLLQDVNLPHNFILFKQDNSLWPHESHCCLWKLTHNL